MPVYGPPAPSLGQSTQTPDPPFDLGLSVQIPYLIIDSIKDHNDISQLYWRKAVTWTKAFNPYPPLDMLIGAVGQGLTDAFNPNLAWYQRVERVLVAIPESGLTGVVSDIIGVGVAVGGTGPGGYVEGQVISSLLIDNIWANYNHKYFGGAGY